ncbi:PREDICTED: chymotrypsin inhibitor-like [Trachymyrmex cornetzi]|uniref:chymotrypsin inhibitor-like n=1 Tax=Trachymyrmex cornetzi TaxID=471704 RepID=UPI00084F1A51|nr:PREDICTED: chymotrypsin inhibitor-like [Trachymyrmex cornetzi]
MSRVSFVLLVMIGVLCSTTIARRQCQENEVWSTCGSACPPSCKLPNPVCILQCMIGCQCRTGYLLNSLGECVLPLNCWKA